MPEIKQVSKFDLNIEKILEGWETFHAVREIIANALDEQTLTRTPDVEIAKDSNGAWHIRDFGRGLKYGHLTQNESEEKLQNSESVVGKFGVGLKDALATLNRKRIGVRIFSGYGDITLGEEVKAGFDDVCTLHAIISPPSNPTLVGTDFALTGISDSDVHAAKNCFLKFTGEQVLESTMYGQIIRRLTSQPARIYVKGLLVAQEQNFAFSYNITSLTTAMNRALNRERTNVGRTAYSDRIKSMLLASTSIAVAQALAEEIVQMEQGTNHDEVLWTDVAVHASRILNATGRVVFATPTDLTEKRDSIDRAVKDGLKVVTVPVSIKDRIQGKEDLTGVPIRSLEVYQREWAEGFKFKFISDEELTKVERRIFELRKKIADLVGGLPKEVKQIRVSETMRPNLDGTCDANGLWEAHEGWITIKRSRLRSVEEFAGTLLHEIAHARTGYSDVSRNFEEELTAMLGAVAARTLKAKASLFGW